jgi:ADP-ribosyl-[dinitrogen reductase] hydrolase
MPNPPVPKGPEPGPAQQSNSSDPLPIACLPVGAGALGMSLCPGQREGREPGTRGARNLDQDLDAIRRWGASVVLTLVEAHELHMLGVPDLGQRVQALGLRWRHLPVADFEPPGSGFEAAWPAVSADLRAVMAAGGRVLVHCRGGLGRSGTVAARLLIDTGAPARQAIERVRAVRPGAIETTEQEQHVLACRPPTSCRWGPPDHGLV